MAFELTQQDRNSETWRRLLEHFKDKRDQLRAKNDGPHDAAITATLRGGITAYTALIALNDD